MSAVMEPTLFCVRVRYVKRGRLRHLSHLELLRTLNRLMRRAGLPYAITQGFSPHMKIAFGPALPVGVASQDEWFDLTCTQALPADEVLRRLQSVSSEDLMPVEASYVDVRGASLSAALTISSYEARLWLVDGDDFGVVEPPEGFVAAVQRVADEVVARGAIEYLRNGKPKTVSLQGRLPRPPRVTPLDAAQEGRGALVEFTTRSSGDGSLRPDVLMGEICARLSDSMTADRPHPAADVPAEGCGVVSCDHCNVMTRVRILRCAQFLESEDGTWVRPI